MSVFRPCQKYRHPDNYGFNQRTDFCVCVIKLIVSKHLALFLIEKAPHNVEFLWVSLICYKMKGRFIKVKLVTRPHYLNLSGRSGRNRLLSLLLFYQATMGPQTLISPGNDSADELARQGALLVPPVVPCSLSSLIFRIHSFLFSD